ncbi:hypothetical protein [Qipengyuania psychrotolerans]|uniref:Uncharacterized protein n=1 Tax=Qipengyuania psychrotolerans TaxID=2867238 RepID=A0ABX8ZFD2_9SPHN|nr:hypothetical protein [Qipengyuania psychrotolerans]QZD86443.1 hypothetical protein K3166_09335 [Qipengyuania psychrotolerans]
MPATALVKSGSGFNTLTSLRPSALATLVERSKSLIERCDYSGTTICVAASNASRDQKIVGSSYYPIIAPEWE